MSAKLQSVTVGNVQAFADTLAELSDATRARKLSAVKSLLSFGHRIGYLPFDVGRPVRRYDCRPRLVEWR